MSDNLVTRAIQLQVAINKQIKHYGEAEINLINDLDNLISTFNSHECELFIEWFSEQNVNEQIDEYEKQRYIQLELGFNI